MMRTSWLYAHLLGLIYFSFNINASNSNGYSSNPVNPFKHQSPIYSHCVNITIKIQHRNSSLSLNCTQSIFTIITNMISNHLSNLNCNIKPSLMEYSSIPFHIQFSDIIVFEHESASNTFTNSLNTMKTKETLISNIESKTFVVIDEIKIYSLYLYINSNNNNNNINNNINKILASGNISRDDNVSWLATSEEREYLYLVCGIVLVCCWSICCISGILCYHDKNKTRRMEIELELEKIKSTSGMPLITSKGSNSNAINNKDNNNNNNNKYVGYSVHDEDEYINDYIRKTSLGAVSIATNNISRNRKHSDATNISHGSHRSHNNNNQQKQQQQQEETMIIANIPSNNDKIQVMTRRGHLKSKTQIEVQEWNKHQLHSRSKSMNIKGDMIEEKTYQMNVNGNAVDMNLSKNIKKNAKKMRNKHMMNQKRRRIKREGGTDGGYDGDNYVDPELTEILSSDNDNESLYMPSPQNEQYWTKGSGTI